jgi:hypothetical protein
MRLWLRLQTPCKQFGEKSQTELVHIIDLDEVTENHEEVGTYQSEVFVDVSLFVEGELELLGLV